MTLPCSRSRLADACLPELRQHRAAALMLALTLPLALAGAGAQAQVALEGQAEVAGEPVRNPPENTAPVSATAQTVQVSTSRQRQVGRADSANGGTVSQQQLAARSVYRPAELLETTPGLIVSQHSGEGKANQFYLRGFNLDHGTDLRINVDGVLVNQRSHSHGQGWSDLNFLIPELASRLDYAKGAFDAASGDFAAAGAVNIGYVNTLERGLFNLGLGQNGYRRTLLADSPALGEGHLLYALEWFKNDGPFVQGDAFNKLNGVLRYSQGNAAQGFSLSAMAYRARWHATDQIPQRALDNGALTNRFDAIDQSDGGNSHRYSLAAEWHRNSEGGLTKINAWALHSGLDLYSNFSYFLNDPLHGDQFSQPDRRTTLALDISHRQAATLFDKAAENTVGVQLQHDNIFNGLYATEKRQRIGTVRADHILETSLGLYWQNRVNWHDKFRTVAGLREDFYRFDVRSAGGINNDKNSGKADAHIGSAKLNLIAGPWLDTEVYVNLGSGFHSNDARGTTLTQDPQSGAPAARVSPLARSKALELGVRTEFIPGLNSTLSLYRLDFASELVFVGDAGTTEAGRPSRRVGIEFSNYYRINRFWTLDADIAFARARFRDADVAGVGKRIPGAVEGVASLALAYERAGSWFGALQWRYFGPRPLIEDNSVRSHSTATVNGRIGYQLSKSLRLELEGFNLANRRDAAIDYYYTSRLPGEAQAGVNDVHFHPLESRSWRVALNAQF